ncbi:SCO7613 C-terminal domain-containing membrane protein [Streptomyces sp. NBC_01477]|uniref:SCO7613 C-terminal domain-containing membrane protein n=1 Tax=Streptomyces sp. NBC_01477 TaxID=2976015 RepID=UPI002E301D4C|nr:hypothetical protein [Streptomyces sp. NBC_01477]
MDAHRCPDCRSYAGPAVADGGPVMCPVCRLPLDGPEILELRGLDAELIGVEERRWALHQRRAALVGALRARRPGTVPAPAGGAAPWTDAPTRSAQTVLLTLGGLLIIVAGLVFTLVSWGRFGIGGRAAVLTALTVLALAAPLTLRRRGLDATAETASAVGLALVLLDAYAARAADIGGLLGVGGAGYWAAVTGLGALATAAYGRLTRSVLMPYAALLLLQCTAPLAAGALHTHATGLAYALLVTAVLDLAVGTWMPMALGAAGMWTAAAGVLAAAVAYADDTYGSALRACVPLVLAAALSLAAAVRPRRLPAAAAAAAAVLGGLALIAAAGVTPRLALPATWTPLAAAAPAALLAVLCLLRLPPLPATDTSHPRLSPEGARSDDASASDPSPHPREPVGGALSDDTVVSGGATGRAAAGGGGGAQVQQPATSWLAAHPRLPLWGGLLGAAAFVLGVAGLGVVPGLARVLAGREGGGVVAVVAGVVAVVSGGAVRRFGRAAAGLRCGAVLAGAAAVVAAPVAVGLPYAAEVGVAGLAAVGGGVHLLRRPAADPAPQLCALLAPGAVALFWSLPSDAAALTVWAAAAVLAACLAAGGRIRVPAAAFAVCAPGYEAARAATAAGLAPHLAAFAVLGVAVATVPVAAALKGRVALAVEYSGYAAGAAALVATTSHPDALSVALAVAGAACAGLALRADRRMAGATGAAALLAASSWVRLALAGVGAPEPYTVSVSAVLLALGHLRRRRDGSVGSWAAYGSGLAFSLLPSLVAAWADTHWLRPLLLGLTALAVTLLGARHRLRAPLATGGAVLLADAAHELAPTVAQSIGHLPHWAPVAAAGGLLLYVGATYERRLLTAQRLRQGFRTLR